MSSDACERENVTPIRTSNPPPEWTKTESSISEAKEYLRQGNIVDFFERITRALLKEQPSSIESFALKLVKDTIDGQAVPYYLIDTPNTPAIQAFVHERQVSDFIDRWVLELLAENPRPGTTEERMQFHLRYLEKCVKEAATPNNA